MRETEIGRLVIAWLVFALFAGAVIVLIYTAVAGFVLKRLEKRRRKLGDRVYRPPRQKHY